MGSSRRPPAVISLSLVILVATTILLSSTARAKPHNHQRPINRHRAPTNASALCRRTDFPALCNAVAKPLLRKGRAVTAVSLAQATMRVAGNRTMRAKRIAGRLMESPRLGSMVHKDLQVCWDSYATTLDNLWTSMIYLKYNSIPDVEINLSAAISNLESCDDAFRDSPGLFSPFVHVNSNVKELVSNSLALVENMK